jgi:hypothetical protein
MKEARVPMSRACGFKSSDWFVNDSEKTCDPKNETQYPDLTYDFTDPQKMGYRAPNNKCPVAFIGWGSDSAMEITIENYPHNTCTKEWC